MNNPQEKPVIIVDTREQQPFSFPEDQFITEFAKLDQGDYSIKGFESIIAIERKSLEDFANSVMLTRFWNELGRLRGYQRAAVVVEATRADILAQKYRSAIKPESLLGAEIAIFADFGVSVVWASTRPLAVDFTRRFFLRFWKSQQEKTINEQLTERDTK